MRSALVLLVATVVIMLGVLEGVTRWVFADVVSASDMTSFFGKRWHAYHEGPLNSLGFRERELRPKRPDVQRVVVVGDSFTYGQGIAREERLTERLDAALGVAVEVHNFGRYGANYPEHVGIMATALDVAEPDFVILQWYTNDVQPPDAPSAPPPGWSSLAGPLHPYVNPHSALYFLANTAFKRVQRAVGLAPTFDDQFAPFRDPETPEAGAARERLERVLDIALHSGTSHGIILWPSIGDRVRQDDFMSEDALIVQVLEVCQDRSLPCLDLRPALRGVPLDQSLAANPFDNHPNARANAHAATATAEWLREQLRQIPIPDTNARATGDGAAHATLAR
jgi:hypothetical protein